MFLKNRQDFVLTALKKSLKVYDFRSEEAWEQFLKNSTIFSSCCDIWAGGSWEVFFFFLNIHHFRLGRPWENIFCSGCPCVIEKSLLQIESYKFFYINFSKPILYNREFRSKVLEKEKMICGYRVLGFFNTTILGRLVLGFFIHDFRPKVLEF